LEADVLEFFASANLSESRLLRFIEARLHCGLMQRPVGSDQMIWSRGLFAILDLDPEIDKPSFSLLHSMQHPDDRVSFELAEARMAAAKPVNRIYRVIRRDGTMRVLSQHIEFLFDESGKPNRSLGVVCDVTEHEALRDQAVLLENRIKALARFPDLILNIVRTDGFVTGLFGNNDKDAEFNRRYGFLWRDIIHPEDREKTIAYIENAIAERSGGMREHRIKQRDGSYRWRRTSWIPVLDRRNELHEFVSISLDIDREKTLATSKEAGKPVTGAQVRAARALVRWSVQNLADMAKVSPSVVRRIEEFDGVTTGVIESLASIRDALIAAGVEFILPATGKPGVRLA
jgi:PAS domain-containing protein